MRARGRGRARATKQARKRTTESARAHTCATASNRVSMRASMGQGMNERRERITVRQQEVTKERGKWIEGQGMGRK